MTRMTEAEAKAEESEFHASGVREHSWDVAAFCLFNIQCDKCQHWTGGDMDGYHRCRAIKRILTTSDFGCVLFERRNEPWPASNSQTSVPVLLTVEEVRP